MTAALEVAPLPPDLAEKLDRYETLLRKWQGAINLVAPSTLADLRRRHFEDSLQLVPLIPAGARVLVDLGSGAGFPGLVLALATGLETHLVESDQRKAEFLRVVSRETSAPVTVHAKRIEQVAPFVADVVTARALAPLPVLLGHAARFAGPHTVAIFPKGRTAEAELAAADLTGVHLTGPAASPKMTVDLHPSRTDPEAVLIRIEGFARG
ncbi:MULTISPECIES: 16S rRNA (guanine(527)-N(7))-methyltransferase RsmG [unclassified Inquilinus]|uniref:16S rRNA (guanine(527)-N(7))-methyltransferase RsmG n=1 Tax=unclassified Inquilinus TaxID=2645927 RepID=UPI003F8FF6DF